jgi:DNA-binding LytR/AlgR family response regulator
MKVRAIALDDEPLALRVIETFCSKIDYIDLQKTFTRTGDAMEYLENFPVDLIFLDINMPAVSGLEFYKKLGQNTLAIFTTAYSEFAVQGFELSALDYLLKPISFDRFSKATQKALDACKLKSQSLGSNSSFIHLRVDYSLTKVELNEILWIEGLDDYLKIHLQGKRPLVVRMTMKAMLEKLHPSQFARIHRSFIVPLQKVQNVRNKTVYLDQKELPIGLSYEVDFMKQFIGQSFF